MMFRLALVALLVASSNASLLRGGTRGMKHDRQERMLKGKKPKEQGDNRDDTTTGGCGTKLNAETMVAFGLDPNMDCDEIAGDQRDDYGCIPTPSQLSTTSDCVKTEECSSQNSLWSCFVVPGVNGPAGLPVGHCGTRQSVAANVDTGKGIGVAESVPKQICPNIAIP